MINTSRTFLAYAGWSFDALALVSTGCCDQSEIDQNSDLRQPTVNIRRQTGQRRVPDFLLMVIACRYELLCGNGMRHHQPFFGFEFGCCSLNGAHVIGVEVGAIQFVCLRILIGIK